MPLNYTAALIAIAAPNFNRLVNFYKALLTLEPTAYTPNVYAEFHLPGVKLGIYRPKPDSEVSTPNSVRVASPKELLRIANSKLKIFPTETLREQNSKLNSSHSTLFPPTSLCLEVVSLEAAIAHITTLGYPPPDNILTASHGREIYAYDPDGNRLILHQGLG